MSIQIDFTTVAEVSLQSVNVSSALGGYVLSFQVEFNVNPIFGKPGAEITIYGVSVSLKNDSGQRVEVGLAHSTQLERFRQYDFSNRYLPTFSLSLSPGQISALETFRESGDLEFALNIRGEGMLGASELEQNTHSIEASTKNTIPRSDWIEKLRQANARDILLIEVPIPLPMDENSYSPVEESLKRAEKLFRNGDYVECVAMCRKVIEDFGVAKYRNPNWNGEIFKKIKEQKSSMNKDDRQAGLLALLQHYTHLANHGASKDGERYYTRTEAQMVLALTASLVSCL